VTSPETEVVLRPWSITPGRERWEVGGVRGRTTVARAVEELLESEPGVRYVSANPASGRVLLRYEAPLRAGEIERVLRRAATAAHAAADDERGASERSGAALTAAVTRAAGLALSARSALGVAATSFPLVVGAGVAVASIAIVVQGWRGSHWARDASRPRSEPSPAVLRHPARRLLEIARRHRRRFALAVIFSALTRVLDVTPPLLLGLTVTILTLGPNPLLAAIGLRSAAAQLYAVASGGALVWSLESAFQYYAALTWRHLAQSIQHDLRTAAYAHVQRLELSYFEGERSGGLAAVINDDVNQLHLFLDTGANELVQVVTNLLIVGPLFYLIAPSIAWIAVLPIPLILWISFHYEDRTAASYADVREKSSLVNGQLVSNLEAIATIKSYSTEEYEAERIRVLSLEYKLSNRTTDALAAAFTPLIRMAVLIAFAGTVVVGGHAVIAGAVMPGTYASMISLTQRFLWPLTTLGPTVDAYQRSISALTRVLDVLDLPVAAHDGPSPLPIASVRGEVVFDRVGFAYRTGPPVLRDLSLRIPPRKTTAIVGVTGAGKTTLVKLLLRLHEPQSGRITLDGIDIAELRTADLRRAIGFVSQEVFLFHGSVRDNIAYGTFEALDEEIRRAARLAQAEPFIEQLPNGYDTIVGERGARLSGGQRQRLSLARAIVKDAPIFVLDEATSAVDNETEAAIQLALRHLAVGRTMIVIAHRLSTVRNADVIYVLGKEGRVDEQGRHEELVRRDGIYASLWRVQSGLAASASR
jgi:ATP-binding cassette, subfamily B, bacterial